MVDALSLSLIDALCCVPDPRSRLGRRHPLPAVLSLLSVGVMCGCRSVYAVLQWGREQGGEMATKLGLGKHGIPTDGMMSNLLRRLDAPAFERALQRWAAAWPSEAAATDVPEGISIDGKTLRGARGARGPPGHRAGAHSDGLPDHHPSITSSPAGRTLSDLPPSSPAGDSHPLAGDGFRGRIGPSAFDREGLSKRAVRSYRLPKAPRSAT